jgi:transposase-like protein
MNPTVKAQAVALLESGEMRVAEIAELLGTSRQLVATWCPDALEARRKWCAKRWSEALKNVDKTVADRASASDGNARNKKLSGRNKQPGGKLSGARKIPARPSASREK